MLSGMKRFSCGDVVPGCTATFSGPSEEEILSQVAKHAQEDHGMKSIPDDVVVLVKRNIRSPGATGAK